MLDKNKIPNFHKGPIFSDFDCLLDIISKLKSRTSWNGSFGKGLDKEEEFTF